MPLTDAHLVALRCPVCQRDLRLDGRVVACADGHHFDLARQGHVQLTAAPISHPGDTTEMVMARQRVQAAGFHDPIRTSVVAALGDLPAGLVVDLGAGTGHLLAAVLDTSPAAIGLALDAAKPAAKRAARAHPRIGSVVADLAEPLPLRDGAARVALSVFAPRPAVELARVLAPGGRLIVVHPLADHLAPLVERLGLLGVHPDKGAEIERALQPAFSAIAHDEVRTVQRLDPATAVDVVMMGPNAFHTSREDVKELLASGRQLDNGGRPIEVTTAVRVSTFRRLG